MRATPLLFSLLVGTLVTSTALAEKGAPARVREVPVRQAERISREHHDRPRLAAPVTERLSRAGVEKTSRFAAPKDLERHGVSKTACSRESTDCRLRPTPAERAAERTRDTTRTRPTAVERARGKATVSWLKTKLCSQRGVCGER